MVKRENIYNIQNLLLKLANNDYESFKENSKKVLNDVNELLENKKMNDSLLMLPSQPIDKTCNKIKKLKNIISDNIFKYSFLFFQISLNTFCCFQIFIFPISKKTNQFVSRRRSSEMGSAFEGENQE